MSTKSLRVLDAMVRILEENNCWNRTVGGWGVDGHVGHITRPHHDVDIVVLEEQIELVQETLRKSGYSFILQNYCIYLKVDGVVVTLGRFDRSRRGYWLITLPSHKWPASFFRGEEATLEGVKFTVPSKEFLLSTKMKGDRRHKGRHDIRLLKQLGTNAKLAERYIFPFGDHRGSG